MNDLHLKKEWKSVLYSPKELENHLQFVFFCLEDLFNSSFIFDIPGPILGLFEALTEAVLLIPKLEDLLLLQGEIDGLRHPLHHGFYTKTTIQRNNMSWEKKNM